MDNLSNFYNDLKSELAVKKPETLINVGTPGSSFSTMSPGAGRWRNLAVKEADKLRDGCFKHIILDIYCKVLPIDSDYIDKNKNIIHSDIDNMLASKNMTPTQYLTSAQEKTNSPLLEFILRSGNNISKEFMKEADETLKDAQKNGIDLPPPVSDIEEPNVHNALVDVKDDAEYRSFVDKLREKTINKIVNDVSKIITDKKEEDDISFKSESFTEREISESTMVMLMDYMNEKLLKENISIDEEKKEEMLGLSIRESVLNEIDSVFRQPNSDFRSFSSRIYFNKGVLVNESTLHNLFPSPEE
jgi:hypothetical protein